MHLKFRFNDGGRCKYYKAKNVGDCVTRAIAIATQRDYKEVYDLVKSYMGGISPRNGVPQKVTRQLLKDLGYRWVATMKVGEGCKTHLVGGEIPMDRTIICKCSRHLVAVVNGVVNDTYDSTRGGSRCVYGYWIIK